MLTIEENRTPVIAASAILMALSLLGLHCIIKTWLGPFLVALWLRLLELLPPYW